MVGMERCIVYSVYSGYSGYRKFIGWSLTSTIQHWQDGKSFFLTKYVEVGEEKLMRS